MRQHERLSASSEGCSAYLIHSRGPKTLVLTAGWYYKSLEAAIFAVAASQGVAQGLPVGEYTCMKPDSS